MNAPSALIVGVGDGLSAALARRLHRDGYRLVLAARDTDKLARLAAEVDGSVHACDASDADAVASLFDALGDDRLDVAVYNPSARTRGPIAELDPAAVARALDVTALGSFLVAQQAARRMLAQPEDARGRRGTILFTGASAGVKGFPRSAPFAMGKFAQRGLAQSMARELHPEGIHVCWVNVDGAIGNPGREAPPDRPDSRLAPDALADAYVALIEQHRSTWSDELALRPWTEPF